MSNTTQTTTTPSLPTTIVTSDWYVNTVNNPSLKSVDGMLWSLTLQRCFDKKTNGFNVSQLKEEVRSLGTIGRRPPKTSGIGNNNEDYTEVMKQTKVDIIALINKNTDKNGNFKGESGKLYRIQNPFFREYVKRTDGKYVMKTTMKTGDTYYDENGKELVK